MWLHDGLFLHVHAHKCVQHGFALPHGHTGRELDRSTIVMNSLLKLWSAAPPLFFPPPCDSPPSPPSFPSLTIVSVWWIGFQPLSINAISCCVCPIAPQRHTCGDTERSRNQHFRAMGLGCMQHKTSNGGLPSDRYWCTLGWCVTKQAGKHTHDHQCSVVKWHYNTFLEKIKCFHITFPLVALTIRTLVGWGLFFRQV